MVKRQLKLSGIEKVLLHLNKFKRYVDQIEVPLELTQEGIANTTGIARPNVANIVKKLIENDSLSEKLLHVQGRKRSRKTYFLTDAGIKEVRTLKKGLQMSQYIDFADQAPQLKYFFGREDEFRKFRNWLKAENSRMLVVSGIAGIGKTAYMAKAVKPLRESMHIFWHRFNEWSTLRSFLTRLGDFLSETGRDRLIANLRAREIIDINEISIILAKDLEFINALLIFDDYHKVKNKKEIVHMFGAIRQLLEDIQGTKAIVIGREMPESIYDERELSIKKTVKELDLGGLDRESGLKLLEERGIVENKREWLYNITMGHPLTLELIHDTEKFETQDEIKSFMKNEIFSLLTPQERIILEVASVFRFPIYSTAYLDVLGPSLIKDTSEDLPLPSEETDNKTEKIDHLVIDNLIKKSLLYESEGVCDIHDVIREFLYYRLPERIRKKYHKRIAVYYLREIGETPQTAIEAQHHLLMAEDYQQAAELVVINGRWLIENGYWQEVLETLEDIPLESIELQHKSEILLLRGHIYNIRGELEDAMEDYQRSAGLFKTIKNKRGEAEAFRNIGHILIQKNMWHETIENYRNALQLSLKIDDIYGVGEAYLGIGRVSWRKGEFDEALVELGKALENSIKAGNNRTTGKVYIDMGNVVSEMGDYDKAIEYIEKSIPLLTTVGDKYEIARAYNNLGLAYSRKGRMKEAIDWYNKCTKLTEEIGNIPQYALGLSNVAEAYAIIGELEKALECCRTALPIIERLDDKAWIANTQLVYGIIYTNSKDWDLSEKHFKNALDVSINAEIPNMTAQIHLHYGRMLIDRDDKSEAENHFDEAMDIWEKLGNKTMVEAVKKEKSV